MTPRKTIYRQKLNTFTTNTTRSPSSPWQLAVVVAFEKMASLSKDSTLPFRVIFGRCFFFVILFFGQLSRAGGRREVLSGGAASPPLGSGAFSPAPFGRVFLVFWEPAPPPRRERESSTIERKEEGHITSVNPTNHQLFIFIKRTAPPPNWEVEQKQHQPKGDKGKAPPRFGREGRQAHATPPSFGGAASLRLHWVVLLSSAFFGWRGRSPFVEVSEVKGR